MRPPPNTRPDLPSFARCERCGEDRRDALRKKPVHGHVLCFNDTAGPQCRRGWCWWCHKENVPLEGHHPLGRKLQASMGYCMTDLTFDLCLNCHQWLSSYLLPFMEQQQERRENTLKTIVHILLMIIAYYAIIFKPKSIHQARSIISGKNKS